MEVIKNTVVLQFIKLGCFMLSFLIGGWVSENIFIPVSYKNLSTKDKIQKIIILSFLSILMFFAGEAHSLLYPDFILYQRPILLPIVIIVLGLLIFCLYNIVKNLIKWNWFRAILYFIPFLMPLFQYAGTDIGIKYSQEKQYWMACREFSQREEEFLQKVQEDKKNYGIGLPIILSYTGIEDSPKLIVYDESKDLEDIDSIHINLFLALHNFGIRGTKYANSPSSAIAIHNVFTKKIKTNFYFIILNSPRYENIDINGKNFINPITVKSDGNRIKY